MATRTTIAACHAHRAGATDTARPAGTAEQPSGTAIAAVAARDERGTTVTAGTEPARRTAIAACVTATAVTDHAAVAATARTTQAGTFVGGVGVAVTQQDARVRIVGGARPDENTDEIGDRVDGRCRTR